MKLIFSKDDDNNLTIQIATGTVVEDFTYVSMIKELIKNNTFDETEYSENISEKERKTIDSMLNKINDSIEEDIIEE